MIISINEMSVLNYSSITEILGKNFQLGSFAVNTVFPGGTAMVIEFVFCTTHWDYPNCDMHELQNPHVDYPYWDLSNQPENWPGIMKARPNSGFPLFLNMQVRSPHFRRFPVPYFSNFPRP